MSRRKPTFEVECRVAPPKDRPNLAAVLQNYHPPATQRFRQTVGVTELNRGYLLSFWDTR